MSKAHRGKGIRKTLKNSRGKCPVCSRTGLKLIYDATIEEKQAKVCKNCHAKLSSK